MSSLSLLHKSNIIKIHVLQRIAKEVNLHPNIWRENLRKNYQKENYSEYVNYMHDLQE
jgi:hypothetical protein